MDSLLVFKGETSPAHLVIDLGKVDKKVTVQFYLSETNLLEECVLVACDDFSILLGHFNCVYLVKGGEKFLIFPKARCWCWNWVTVLNGSVKVNGMAHGIDVKLSKEFLYLEVGSVGLKGLVKVNKDLRVETELESEIKIVGNFKPIKSLAELHLWEGKNPEHQSRVPYTQSKKHSSKQLLICHDCGSSNYNNDIGPNSIPCTYRYFHYMHTDIFIYFSHSRISIPPVAWTDSAHRNKTQVLGTFITENEEGTQENKKLSENVNFYAELLTKLMVYYGFDGYLINIEAKSEDPGKISEFLETLTLVAHSANSESKIIWYDSMDESGEIRWKSELNPGNLQFLQGCDGFFTDYHWKPGMPERSAQFAGDDNWKVFTGTDVYGRGTWGGGGFDTKVGVEASSSTSCAIFAPGWTWEKVSGRDFPSFFEAEKLMWAQRANPIIDSGGKILKNREKINELNILSQWEVFVSPDRHNNESFNWEKKNNGGKYWEVNKDLEFIASFVKTKRVVKVSLSENKGQNVNFVYGRVEVKGTGPKVNDNFWVELKVRTRKGEESRKIEAGVTGDEWKVIQLEIEADQIVEVTWTEAGFDVEHWQGFFGSRFRNTQVVYREEGNSLLDNFEEKTLLEPFSTWFNIGQGPKLWKKGLVLLDSIWNSLHDFDLLPSFLVLSKLPPNFEQVFHGTNSLFVPLGTYQLFKCDFLVENLSLNIYYKGKISVLLNGIEKIGNFVEEGWSVDKFIVNGHVENIFICAEQESYLAGLQMFKEVSQFSFANFKFEVHWNVKSLSEPRPVFDLAGRFEELPVDVRHVDIYLNKKFINRIYNTEFLLKDLQADSEEFEFSFAAESIQGDILDTYSFSIPLSLVESQSPLLSE